MTGAIDSFKEKLKLWKTQPVEGVLIVHLMNLSAFCELMNYKGF
jgi:hypothetical protein